MPEDRKHGSWSPTRNLGCVCVCVCVGYLETAHRMYLKVASQNVLIDKDTLEPKILIVEDTASFPISDFLPHRPAPGGWGTGKKWERAEFTLTCPCFSPFCQPLRDTGIPSCKFWSLLGHRTEAVPAPPIPSLHGAGALLLGPIDQLFSYFLPAISDFKTTSCIGVQDNKFPEDKNYILLAIELGHHQYFICINQVLWQICTRQFFSLIACFSEAHSS